MNPRLAHEIAESIGLPGDLVEASQKDPSNLTDYFDHIPAHEVVSIFQKAEEQVSIREKGIEQQIKGQEARILELESHVAELNSTSREKESVLCDILSLLNDDEDLSPTLVGEVRLSDIRDGKTNFSSTLLAFVEAQLTKEEELQELLIEARDAKKKAEGASTLPSPEFIHPPIHDIMRHLGTLTKSNLDIEQRKSTHGIVERLKDLVAALVCEPKLTKPSNSQVSAFARNGIDLERLCIEVCGYFKQQTAERSIKLQLQLDPGLPATTYGDERHLRNLLSEVIDHRIKSLDSGNLNLNVSQDGRLIAFELVDSGSGMDAEQLSEVLKDEITSGSPQEKLADCRRIIERMGGRMAAHSLLGKGTTFRIELPMVQQPIFEANTETAPAIDTPLSSNMVLESGNQVLRVLIVEDNPTNRFVASKTVEHLGHEVATAANGSEAVDTLQQHPFDVVFMDLDMPIMNGIEATRNIRSLTGSASDTKIFALTGNRFGEIREQCTAAGMNGFISKPFEVNEIQNALDSIQVA